jgi:hypothetical protein
MTDSSVYQGTSLSEVKSIPFYEMPLFINLNIYNDGILDILSNNTKYHAIRALYYLGSNLCPK